MFLRRLNTRDRKAMGTVRDSRATSARSVGLMTVIVVALGVSVLVVMLTVGGLSAVDQSDAWNIADCLGETRTALLVRQLRRRLVVALILTLRRSRGRWAYGFLRVVDGRRRFGRFGGRFLWGGVRRRRRVTFGLFLNLRIFKRDAHGDWSHFKED